MLKPIKEARPKSLVGRRKGARAMNAARQTRSCLHGEHAVGAFWPEWPVRAVAVPVVLVRVTP